MADSVQIKVDTAELEKSERKLSALSKSISNRRVKVQFTNAKGAVADNLTTAANQLNEIGAALASLIQKTETAITNTRVSFTNTDNALAQWWGHRRSNMKRRVGFGIIVSLLILMIGVCGCTMNNSDLPSNTESEVSLNQRQKDILTEQGLSTEYTELSASQQKAIVAIEEMLVYVEKKYNTSFSYAGYSAQSSLEKEHMRAFPTSGDKETDSFTITKTDAGYEDDYINVAANAIYVAYVSDGIKTILPDTEIKVFAEITKTSLVEVPTVDTDLQGKVESSLWIFIDGANFSEQDLTEFKANFNDYLTEHQLYGMAQLVLLKDGKIAYPTKYNYTDYLSEEHYAVRETLYVNK